MSFVKHTLAEAREILKEHGLIIRKRDGEYRVNFRGQSEDSAHYTNDLNDAINTGLTMADRVPQQPPSLSLFVSSNRRKPE